MTCPLGDSATWGARRPWFVASGSCVGAVPEGGPALLLGELSAQLTERLTSPALRATSPMRRGFGALRYRNRDSLIMPEAGSPRASPYNRSQAINISRPAALCVGAVPKAFLARQVPTNGRRKAVAKTDSSGWRPAVKNAHIPNGSMWHGFANCEPRSANGQSTSPALRATSPMRRGFGAPCINACKKRLSHMRQPLCEQRTANSQLPMTLCNS